MLDDYIQFAFNSEFRHRIGYSINTGFVGSEDDDSLIIENVRLPDSRLPLQTGAGQSGSYKAWKTSEPIDRSGQAGIETFFLRNLHPVWFKKSFQKHDILSAEIS